MSDESGPRVLWVSHAFGYGGDLMYFGEIFRHFHQMVPNMAVVVDRDTPYRNDYHIPMLPLMRLFRKPLRRAAPDGQVYVSEVAIPDPGLILRLARQRAAALIAIEFTPPALMATLVAWMTRRPLVLLVESDPAARGGSSHPLVRAIKRWAVRRASVIQTNNAKGRRYLIEDLCAPRERIVVAPYLTSRPPGPVVPPTRHDGTLRLLFANTLTERKGLRQLLAAMALLPPETRARIALTIIGDGPERAPCEALAAGLGMGKRLRFMGKRAYAQLGEFYANADVLAIPSLADYRSLAGFEGLGYGLALLASRNDGASDETVEGGVNGFIIDPEDAPQIARRLAELADDPELLLQMRQASALLYDRHFSLAAIAQNLARSVETATGQPLASAGAEAAPPQASALERRI